MNPLLESPPPGFDSLRTQGIAAYEAGDLDRALELLDRAMGVARRHGDPRLVDLAVCNHGQVLIELGRGSEVVTELRALLLRDRDPVNYFLAAYQIARYHELTKSYKKGLFYARIARDRAKQLDDAKPLATSHNLIGNLLLAENFIDEAAQEYRLALDLMPEAADTGKALALANMGYCHALKSQFQVSFRLLYKSLRVLRRLRARRDQIGPRLALCYAHLEVGRYEDSSHHGRVALELCETCGDSDGAKNALYLLGQCAVLAGEIDRACDYFNRLQETYYPDNRLMSEFLLAVDVREMINLKR